MGAGCRWRASSPTVAAGLVRLKVILSLRLILAGLWVAAYSCCLEGVACGGFSVGEC